MLPTLGILIFVGLYYYSSKLYPGGSQADVNSIGFDWVHNYWCNLMNQKGINGQQNPAKPFAIVAMLILCTSLALFFIQFSKKIATPPFWKPTIKIFGILSMSTAVFIFTKYHDLMTIVASIFGLFVVVGIIWEMAKSSLHGYKIGGIICILLLALNNYIYYNLQGIYYLPLLQKITFVVILTWVVGLNYLLSKNNYLKADS